MEKESLSPNKTQTHNETLEIVETLSQLADVTVIIVDVLPPKSLLGSTTYVQRSSVNT